MSVDLLIQLRDLELSLHQPAMRRDPARLDELLHDSFVEIGRSGRSYTKSDILEHLPKETGQTAIWSQGFQLAEIAEGVALLTYRSASVDANGELSRHTLRSSLWQRTAGGWQLRFHQGTPSDSPARSAGSSRRSS